jgi:hypothetical protein
VGRRAVVIRAKFRTGWFTLVLQAGKMIYQRALRRWL